MYTLTTFTHIPGHAPDHPAIMPGDTLYSSDSRPPLPAPPRYRVVLAGKEFFHIKDSTTGQVRGFRGDHNEACALARTLEVRA